MNDKTLPLHDMQVLLPPANIEGDYLSGWVEGQSYLILNYGTDEAFEAATKTCDTIETLQSRIEAMEARLEIDPSQPYDGIYTRDETIRLLDTRIEELKDANKKAALDLLAALGQSTELMDRVRVLEDTINKIQLRTTSHPDDTPDDDKRDKGIANMLARHVMKND